MSSIERNILSTSDTNLFSAENAIHSKQATAFLCWILAYTIQFLFGAPTHPALGISRAHFVLTVESLARQLRLCSTRVLFRAPTRLAPTPPFVAILHANCFLLWVWPTQFLAPTRLVFWVWRAHSFFVGFRPPTRLLLAVSPIHLAPTLSF